MKKIKIKTKKNKSRTSICDTEYYPRSFAHVAYSREAIALLAVACGECSFSPSSKRTVRVSERSTVVPRCVRLGGYYCTLTLKPLFILKFNQLRVDWCN